MTKIVTKHYVEYFLPVNKDKEYETSWRNIEERDPLIVEKNDLAVGFRFFDISEATLKGGEKLTGIRKNYSPMYYYGTRYREGELEQAGLEWVNLVEKDGIKSVIQCECGCIIINPYKGDMTIEEYKKTLPKTQVKKLKKNTKSRNLPHKK